MMSHLNINWRIFEQFLSTESKTEENRKKDKDLFTEVLWNES